MLNSLYSRCCRIMAKHPRILFGEILLFALVIRLIFWYGNPVVGRDELYYFGKAIGGQYFSSLCVSPGNHPPLPEALLKTTYQLFSISTPVGMMISARTLSLCISILGIAPYYFIGQILFSRKLYSFLLMFFAAVMPIWVELSVTFLRESFTIPIAAYVLWGLLCYLTSPNMWKCALLGLGVATGAMCRYEFVEWLLFCVLGIAITIIAGRRKLLDALFDLLGLGITFSGLYLLMPILLGQDWNSQIIILTSAFQRLYQ